MNANGKKTAKQVRGFTLVELITVVAIIAILASLILTALTQGKSRARSILCQHNLRQQGVLLLGFAQDHGEFPLVSNHLFSEGGYPDHSTTWISALFRYANNKDRQNLGVFRCPSNPRPSMVPRNEQYWDFGYNTDGLIGHRSDTSLGIGREGRVDSDILTPVRQTDVLFPSGMLAIGDGLTGWQGIIADGIFTIGREYWAEERFGSTARAQSRHKGKANFVFCDGHIESVSLKRLFQSKDPVDLQLWNRDGKPHLERL